MAETDQKIPSVSILLPTHNRADVLAVAIASVLDQNHNDFELLVVGDGCTDDTAALMDGIDDPRIRWFDLPKASGMGYSNRNIALAEARGHLVAYMAHDDLWMPDHLERMVPLFAQPAIRWAYSRPLWVGGEGHVYPMFANLRINGHLQHFLNRRNCMASCAVMHRRACFDDVGFWPAEMAKSGDWAMWRRIIRRYGAQCVGFQRLPTTLHFRANWREGPVWGPPALSLMDAMAQVRGQWPSGLCLPINDTDTPQHTSYVALRDERAISVKRLRRAVLELQDEMAWSASQSTLFN